MKRMKNTPSNRQPHSRLFLLLTISLVAMCACTITKTSDPYVPGEEPVLTKAEPTKKRKKSGLFTKKPGDAEADFRRDIRNGHLKLKQYGAPGPITPYYNKLLTEDLGIKIEVIADGLISGEMLRYAKQYNALMTTEIQRKYGPGILQEAQRRAQIMQAEVERSAER
jgi:hypothetical protein